MTFVLGKRSKQRLEGVHPDLAKLVPAALAISATDFTVVCGVRSRAEQIELYAQGRTTQQMRAMHLYDAPGRPTDANGKPLPVVTWTLNSKHFINEATGYGHAVDLAPFVDGKILWERWDLFKEIARAMRVAAKELDVPIEWGGDWTTPDGPHFQLPNGYKGA